MNQKWLKFAELFLARRQTNRFLSSCAVAHIAAPLQLISFSAVEKSFYKRPSWLAQRTIWALGQKQTQKTIEIIQSSWHTALFYFSNHGHSQQFAHNDLIIRPYLAKTVLLRLFWSKIHVSLWFLGPMESSKSPLHLLSELCGPWGNFCSMTYSIFSM
jgi:hypothetical protein